MTVDLLLKIVGIAALALWTLGLLLAIVLAVYAWPLVRDGIRQLRRGK